MKNIFALILGLILLVGCEKPCPEGNKHDYKLLGLVNGEATSYFSGSSRTVYLPVYECSRCGVRRVDKDNSYEWPFDDEAFFVRWGFDLKEIRKANGKNCVPYKGAELTK